MDEKNETAVRVIENATRADVRPGDHITWEQTEVRDGLTITTRREGIAHHRNRYGDWETAEGGWLTEGEGEDITITIRRPAHELPTEPETVIVANDGHEYITATVDGETFRAREALLISWGRWYGAWRSETGAYVFVDPDQITPGTWKKGDR